MKFEVNYIKEDGWQGSVDHTEIWEHQNKEEFFERVYRENCKMQKEFHGNRSSYEPSDYDLQDEYDDWWLNTPEDKKELIMLTA